MLLLCLPLLQTETREAWVLYLLCIRDAAHCTLRPALHSHGISLGSLWPIWLSGIAMSLLRPRLRSLLLCVRVVSSVWLRPHLPHLIHWLEGCKASWDTRCTSSCIQELFPTSKEPPEENLNKLVRRSRRQPAPPQVLQPTVAF